MSVTLKSVVTLLASSETVAAMVVRSPSCRTFFTMAPITMRWLAAR